MVRQKALVKAVRRRRNPSERRNERSCSPIADPPRPHRGIDWLEEKRRLERALTIPGTSSIRNALIHANELRIFVFA
ncbi:unnamed protein product [Strongylus vulgaris]|uniref:Uncharacterized protein n=1 Tax=Strongylus vulgaris TaxID=40348 RepID=A0A3P7I4V3_STRVU|nr:unnamed protein product [Strongylus vulgaris]